MDWGQAWLGNERGIEMQTDIMVSGQLLEPLPKVNLRKPWTYRRAHKELPLRGGPRPRTRLRWGCHTGRRQCSADRAGPTIFSRMGQLAHESGRAWRDMGRNPATKGGGSFQGQA